MLTAGLFPYVYLNRNGTGARVINVSSLAHAMASNERLAIQQGWI
jgi:hypothetical protein